MRHPLAGLEVLLVERTAMAAPAIAASAEKPAAVALGKFVGQAGVLAVVQIVGGTVLGKATALEQADRDAFPSELQGHDDAGNASANDAHLRVDRVGMS